MTEQSPGEAAQVEAARQAVMFVFGVAGTAATLWLMRRYVSGGADGQRDRARAQARREERWYARLAGWAWRQAERRRLDADDSLA